MAILDRFYVNSDYPTIKEVNYFEKTLEVPQIVIHYYEEKFHYVDITVPSGMYISNMTLNFSGTGYQTITTPSPVFFYDYSVGTALCEIRVGITTVDNKTLRLYAEHFGAYIDPSLTIPAFTVKVNCHLFTSPFD